MSLDVQRIRALCFDVDGTLRDTDDKWVNRFERFLKPLRFVFPGRNVRPFARWVVMTIETPGNLVLYLLDRLGFDDEVARLFKRMAKRDNKQMRDFWLIPGIAETLSKLKEKYPMAVVSARGKEGTVAFLEQSELMHLFDAIATSQTCEHTKPYPDPVVWAAEQMCVDPRTCLMIGDTTVDIKAGRAAGAQTVGVLCGFGTEKELRRARADLILESPAQLVEVMMGLQDDPG
ncbi:MAG: HAD family hydrolase [Anaerolineaceae bacterium]|nr:HAD family hydrolase [Anaerolineaceae bacterium]